MSAEAYSPIAPLFRVCDGVRIRFADNRADSSLETVLMLSPWPESLWAFRGIWDRVSGVARVVAIDLPGFGHSDGRPELIAPDAMGTYLARLIEEWDLGAPHVVGPDVGTAAALYLAATAPDRVTSLTIGGGAVRTPIDAGGALKDIIEAPSLDDVRQLDARTNIDFAVEPAAGSDSEPDVHEDYVSVAVVANEVTQRAGDLRPAALRRPPLGVQDPSDVAGVCPASISAKTRSSVGAVIGSMTRRVTTVGPSMTFSTV